jgi:hypothetical protein
MEKDKLQEFISVMENIYGKYDTASGRPFVPKTYTEYKGRYLWTDAFGVCNFLTLFYETGDTKFLTMADGLIANVHDVLGRDRKGERRLADSTDENPLRGGLRIGKIDPEGTRDGDGQYFHYLTKWAFALNRMSRAKNEPHYNDWAAQLIKATHRPFVYNRETDEPHMYWKMSIDLSRPAVRSEGNLDPFDGYVTYRIVQHDMKDPAVLADEVRDMEKMVKNKFKRYSSNDPLDLGEALWISHWFPEEEWSQVITQRSAKSLEYLYRGGQFDEPPEYRLAFREFGTTIGVQVTDVTRGDWTSRVRGLHSFWHSHGLHTRDSDITPVMYCTSLNPGVFYRNYPKQKPFAHVRAL